LHSSPAPPLASAWRQPEPGLASATDALTSAGHQAIGVVCDVSDEERAAAAVDSAVATYGRLDFTFNNAGVQVPPSDAADEPAANFDRVTAINLRGVWTCMKHELHQMRELGSGAIVNCSSLGGLVGQPTRGAYHAAKHGVIGLSNSAGVMCSYNRVNGVHASGVRAKAAHPSHRQDPPHGTSWTG
jgi:NAD(P)-dependent dehydrogenase (short-subunit alcohol dehydrogenase family)